MDAVVLPTLHHRAAYYAAYIQELNERAAKQLRDFLLQQPNHQSTLAQAGNRVKWSADYAQFLGKMSSWAKNYDQGNTRSAV